MAQHAAAWTLAAQKQALDQVRRRVLSAAEGRDPTPHFHANDIEGAENIILALRFLHDLEGRVEELERACSSCEEVEDGDEPSAAKCTWTPLELFCRPWVIGISRGSRRAKEILRLEEHVPGSLRALCGVFFPCGIPIGALLAWVTVQSPRAFTKLHVRRIMGNRISPCRVRLDQSYRVEAPGLGPGALAEAAVAGRWPELVRGDVPRMLLRG